MRWAQQNTDTRIATLKQAKQRGFTIVELLIVIVVIAILAAISVVAYSGIQDRANSARTATELKQLEKAIILARTNTGKTLFEIINDGTHTSGACTTDAMPAGTDIRSLPEDHNCWNRYRTALERIAQASGSNLNGLSEGDHRGVPYYIDQNEAENGDPARACVKDLIGTIVNPLPTSMTPTYVWVANRIDLPLTGRGNC